MKKRRLEQRIIEEFQKFPNPSFVCEKVGISRHTFYRWRDLDKKFNERIEEALSVGNDSLCDLAESKLLTNVNNGNQRSIEYLLSHRSERYKPKKPTIEDKVKLIPVREIYHEDFDPNKHSTVRKDIDY